VYHLVNDEVEGARLPQNHPGLGQHSLLVVGLAVRFGAGLVARLPVARPLVGLGVGGVPHTLEGGEEGGELLEAALVQALVLAACIQGPSKLVAGLLWGEAER